jgi:hypothetical protein
MPDWKGLLWKNALAYFSRFLTDEEKRFIALQPVAWGQCYKTFSVRDLWIFVLS